MSDGRLAPVGRDLVWFRGGDVVRFLNDLISQEIEQVEPGTVVRSFLLGPRGKLDHLLWALRGDDEIGLITDEGRGAELAATLGRYRIRVDVEVLEPVRGWLVLGEGTTGAGWARDHGQVRADLPWQGPPLRFGTGDEPALDRMSESEWVRVCIDAAEPRFGVDVDEGTIPQETGLVAVSVDFSKGCYLGQELVARIDSRGRVNRKLRRLELEAPVPTGVEITLGDKVVGTLTSSAGDAGLALLHRDAGPGSPVTLGGVGAVVID